MILLGEWAISLLLASACPTPTAWVEVSTVRAVCGDEDGIPVYRANRWAIPGNDHATQAEFDLYNDRDLVPE